MYTAHVQLTLHATACVSGQHVSSGHAHVCVQVECQYTLLRCALLPVGAHVMLKTHTQHLMQNYVSIPTVYAHTSLRMSMCFAG